MRWIFLLLVLSAWPSFAEPREAGQTTYVGRRPSNDSFGVSAKEAPVVYLVPGGDGSHAVADAAKPVRYIGRKPLDDADFAAGANAVIFSNESPPKAEPLAEKSSD